MEAGELLSGVLLKSSDAHSVPHSGHRTVTLMAHTALDPHPPHDQFIVRDQAAAGSATRTAQGTEDLAVNETDMAIDPVDSALDTTGHVTSLSLHPDPLLS